MAELARGFGFAEGDADGVGQLDGFDGLVYEVQSGVAGAFGAEFVGDETGDQNDGEVAAGLADGGDELEAGHGGHVEIAEE